MRVFYAPQYEISLGGPHPFPMEKYPLTRELLVEGGLVTSIDAPAACGLEDLERVHDRDYVASIRSGELDPHTRKALGLPWSEALVVRSLHTVQGTLEAARAARAEGLSGNLAGGTHHAFRDRGEGFCVFNDCAVAIERLRSDGESVRALILDLDVHQGNGNAAVFAADPDTFTFSIHGARNYPLRKVPSDRDVGLPDGTGDDEYLSAVKRHVPEVLDAFRPDLVFYLAGVDPHEDDRFGRMRVTTEGLAERERFVLGELLGRSIPTAVLLAGGYAPTPRATAELHTLVFRAARELRASTR